MMIVIWCALALLGLLCREIRFPHAWIDGFRQTLPSSTQSTPKLSSFVWSDIVPSPSLVYRDCYDGFQCARLEVPMDWRVEGSEKVAIAVIRRPAKVQVTDARYGGAILVNPGGPSDSGIMHAVRIAEQLQTIVDSDDEGGLFFDVIGFDPRGVGYTTPKLECFADYLSRQYWQITAAAEGALASGNVSFASKLARGQSIAQSCVDRAVNHNASIAYHMNSAPVAADMLSIVERHGEWREKTARTLLKQPTKELRSHSQYKRSSTSEADAILARTEWKVGREKLLYHGVSYGTVLGQLFAHLHPDRVSRIVLDAVVDTDVYLGSKWDAPIAQSDDILEYFFRACSNSSACAFREDSIEKTRARFHHLIESLDISPLPVSSTSEHSADVVTSSDLRRYIREVVYHPVATFPLLDRLLVELADGNGTTMAIRKQSGLLSRDRQLRRCDPGLAFDLSCHDQSQWENEPAAAIICSDTRTISDLTDEEFLDFAESLQKRSWVMGWYWTELQLPCKGWTIRPSWHIDAPLGSNTSEPMLLIGNTVDPVTPLQSAINMSQQFPRSVVLNQDCSGHGSFSYPSLCTAKMVRQYFQKGQLPSQLTKCGVDDHPFTSSMQSDLSGSDEKLFEALRHLAYHTK